MITILSPLKHKYPMEINKMHNRHNNRSWQNCEFSNVSIILRYLAETRKMNV